jgi:ribose-phosphate pyrophosphokinase
MSDILLYSTRSYAAFAAEMGRAGGFRAGRADDHAFPDGERYRRIETRCEGADVALVGGTVSDEDTLELYDLACGLVHYGAARLTLVIPYYGYSTMERATRDGEIVTAKTRARMLSSIPAAGLGTRVILLDLHVDSVTHYFEGSVQPVHVDGTPVTASAIRRVGGPDFVLGSTDAGRAKWVESLAHDLGVAAAFVYKRRLDGDRTEVSGVSAHVSGKRVVIYDDMIRSGGSLVGAALAYRAAGATSVAAVTTHGLFVGDALDRIAASGLFDALVATDSHPRARAVSAPIYAVDTVAPLLAAQLVERSS